VGQITAWLPGELVQALDTVAGELHTTRAELVRAAIEHYLADPLDLAVAGARLLDPADAVLEWDALRSELLAAD
jgi:predicted DNA-binding protein